LITLGRSAEDFDLVVKVTTLELFSDSTIGKTRLGRGTTLPRWGDERVGGNSQRRKVKLVEHDLVNSISFVNRDGMIVELLKDWTFSNKNVQ
jgi:hypothetical protein